MSKFIKLFESALGRFTRGGLLTGDLVKFKDKALSDEFFKTQPENYVAKVKDMMASDLNIKVANIKPRYASAMSAGNTDYTGTEFNVDVVQELMPGKWVNPITVPAHLLIPVETYPSLSPIPNSVKYDNKIQIQPKEYKAEENETVEFYKPTLKTHRSDNGKGKMEKGDRELLNKNTKIPAKEAEGQKDPAVGTWRYLPKEKK